MERSGHDPNITQVGFGEDQMLYAGADYGFVKFGGVSDGEKRGLR